MKIKKMGIFCAGKNAKPSLATLPPLSWLTMFFKGPAPLVYNITLNLNISASRQNIKKMICNFGAIHVGIMQAKFQASSFTRVGGEYGDRCTRDIMPDPCTKFLNSPLRFGRDKFIKIFNPKLCL